MATDRESSDDYTIDITQDVGADVAETGDAPDDITDAEVGGNPTTLGLTAGGTGIALEDDEESGGASGSGGGVVDRIGGRGTVGGESGGTLGGTSVGSPFPPRPEDPGNGAP